MGFGFTKLADRELAPEDIYKKIKRLKNSAKEEDQRQSLDLLQQFSHNAGSGYYAKMNMQHVNEYLKMAYDLWRKTPEQSTEEAKQTMLDYVRFVNSDTYKETKGIQNLIEKERNSTFFANELAKKHTGKEYFLPLKHTGVIQSAEDVLVLAVELHSRLSSQDMGILSQGLKDGSQNATEKAFVAGMATNIELSQGGLVGAGIELSGRLGKSYATELLSQIEKMTLLEQERKSYLSHPTG